MKAHFWLRPDISPIKNPFEHPISVFGFTSTLNRNVMWYHQPLHVILMVSACALHQHEGLCVTFAFAAIGSSVPMAGFCITKASGCVCPLSFITYYVPTLEK